MPFLKAQSDIIAVVLIVLIAIGLLGVAYTFGLPLIQKNQDRALEDRAKAFFSTENINSLPSKLQNVANSGGKDTANLDVTGITKLFPGSHVGIENDSIDFTFQSRVSSYAVDKGWISLSSTSCPPMNGVIGQDQAASVCVRADSTTAGYYNITYRVQMRTLEDAQRKNGFGINLIQNPASSLISSHSTVSIRLEFDSKTQQAIGSENLIITNVKVLLV